MRKSLIEDIIFLWEHLRDIEKDALKTFSEVSRGIGLVSRQFDSNGIPYNGVTMAIERLGVLKAIRLLSFITHLRKEGVTLERFLWEYRDTIRNVDSNFLRIFVIPKYSDIFE